MLARAATSRTRHASALHGTPYSPKESYVAPQLIDIEDGKSRVEMRLENAD